MDRTVRYKGIAKLRAMCTLIGVEIERVLRNAGIPLSVLADEGRGFTAAQTFAMWDAAFSLAGPKEMGVDLGRRMTQGPFTPQIFAFACSPDIVTGLERLAIFKPIVGPYRLDIREIQDGIVLSVRSPDIDAPLPATMQPTEIGFLIEMMRTCAGSVIRPLWITVHPDCHSQSEMALYAECEIRHGPVFEIALSHQDARPRAKAISL